MSTYDRNFSAEQRQKLAKSGAAMKGGGYPIENESDLRNAMQALGRASNRGAVIAHIKTRARALGVTLPKDWPNQKDSFTSLQMRDYYALDNVSIKGDGYMTAVVRAARTGIQEYYGDEVGHEDASRVIRVYRPPEEVFNRDSLRSYAHRPVTNDHPPEGVNSSNWRKYAVGDTGDEVARDGEYVRIPLCLMDQSAIDDYQAGKKELSLGYATELVWGDGVTPDGEHYDAKQTKIRANHLALVRRARGGPNLRIGDDDGDHNMTLKSVTIDGITVEMTDSAAQVVLKTISSLEKQLADAFAKYSKAEEAAESEEEKRKEAAAGVDAAMKTKDAEIATLKKQLADAEMTPAKLDAMVKDRAGVVDQARRVLGDKLVVDGKTVQEIRRQVVDALMGDASKGWSDDAVSASFALAAKSSVAPPVGQADRLAVALSNPATITDARAKAYADREEQLRNAWKTKPAA